MFRQFWVPLAACTIALTLRSSVASSPLLAADSTTMAWLGAQSKSTANRVDAKQFAQWMTTLSNWGRWGPNDELGALNLITPQKRQAAIALVRRGEVISLARPQAIVATVSDNPFRMQATTSAGGVATDRIEMAFHGILITHVDALCHFSYNGKMYNGYPFEQSVTTDRGCQRLGIGNVRDRLVTRGVLIDIPRLRGVPYLEPGTHVFREDVEAWERRAGVKVGAGDAILLRTGRWARSQAVGPSTVRTGYDLSFVPFLKERDVAIMASDWTHDVGTVEGVEYPVHRFAIVALGMTLLDNLDLEALAARLASLNRWEFLLSAAPASAANGTGAPINPIAMF